MTRYATSPMLRRVLGELHRLDVLAGRACERLFEYNEHDSGLSTGHAIMRGGPQVRLSPGLGAASPHEAKS